MRSLRRFAIFAAVLCGAPSAARAQNRDTTQLAPIVVTATRAPAPSNTLPNAVTVLEGADLERAGIVTVSDAVRALAGVVIAQVGSFGGVTSLFLRGGQSSYVRVLLDGVPVNATGGYLDLANLSTLNVERIELVRGPSSVLYGSDAVSGVMQIFTRRPSGGHADLTARVGSYGSSDLAAGLSAGRGTVGATFALAQSATDGIYDFNNHYRNTTLSGSVRFAPDRRTDLNATARYGDALFRYPTDGSGAANDSNQFQTARALTASLEAGRFLAPRLEGRLLLGYNEVRGRTEDAQDSGADTSGLYEYHSRGLLKRMSADLRLNVHGGRSSVFTVGGVIESESERDTNSYKSSFGPGGGFLDTSRTNRAAYVQAVTLWRDRVWMQAGARLDDNDKFGAFRTWRLGATARVAGGTRVRANFGTAFKEPTFDENYSSGFTTGNPDLKPERSQSWEVGIEQALAGARGSVSAAYFDQTFRDMIQYAYVPNAPNFYNIAGATASGVEVEALYSPSAAVRLRGQYTWLRTKVSDPGYDSLTFAPGRPLVRRPEHSASLEADAAPTGRFAGGARVVYVGRREDLDFSQFARVTLAAYTRIDLWVDVALRPVTARGTALALTARLDNARDARYSEAFGFRTPGRVLRMGVRLDSGR